MAAGQGNGNGHGNGAEAGNGAGRGAGVPATVAMAATPESTEPAVPALEVTDLTVRFGGIQAVGGVSLSVAPGEIVGIIGPNGAGKTTLFDLISGFTRADAGRVLLGGRDLTGRRRTSGPASGSAARSRTPGSSRR